MSRVKIQYRQGSRENYDRFCRKFPQASVSFRDWVEIIRCYNDVFREYLLETGDEAKLPWGLGSIHISKKKVQKFKTLPDGTQRVNLPVNWKETRKQGKTIYNFNHHTDGYRYKWSWKVHSARFQFPVIWIFKPSRKSSRLITQYLNKPDTKFKYLYRERS